MNRSRSLPVAPGPKSYWPLPLHFVNKLRRDPFFAMEAMRRHGPIVRFRAGIWTAHLVVLPEHIKHIMQDRAENYPRSRFYRIFELLVGKGLLANEGPNWQRQRQMIQPAFSRERLAGYIGEMVKATTAMLDRWQTYAKTGQPFDLAEEMKWLSLRIIGQTLCGFDLERDAGELAEATTRCLDYGNYRMHHMFRGRLPLPTRRNRQFRQAREFLNRAVLDVISKRINGDCDPNDLLSQLLHTSATVAGSAVPQRMSAQQLRDEVMTFIVAGHETVAATVTWASYLLAQHPECDQHLHREVADVLSGNDPSFASLPQLTYTEMVLSETMRLYPPGWRLSRTAIADDELAGYHIAAGSMVLLSPYITHRLPEFWENPDAFVPERFARGRSASRPRYAYYPFSAGPHRCIGSEFAMLETTVVLAMIAQRYRVRLLADQLVEPDWNITLRPRHGLWVTIAGPSAAGHDGRPQLAASQL